MKNARVLLENGSVGEVIEYCGDDYAIIELVDENGNFIYDQGFIAEVL